MKIISRRWDIVWPKNCIQVLRVMKLHFCIGELWQANGDCAVTQTKGGYNEEAGYTAFGCWAVAVVPLQPAAGERSRPGVVLYTCGQWYDVLAQWTNGEEEKGAKPQLSALTAQIRSFHMAGRLWKFRHYSFAGDLELGRLHAMDGTDHGCGNTVLSPVGCRFVRFSCICKEGQQGIGTNLWVWKEPCFIQKELKKTAEGSFYIYGLWAVAIIICIVIAYQDCYYSVTVR